MGECDGWRVTAFVFHKGALVFLRSKLQGGIGSGGVAAGFEQVGINRIVQECADSIYACQQQTPELAISHAVLIADDALGPGLRQQLEKIGRTRSRTRLGSCPAVWRRPDHRASEQRRIAGHRGSRVKGCCSTS